MARGEGIREQVVVHDCAQIRFGEDVLHPLLEGEVVDAAPLRETVSQVPRRAADRALGTMRVHVLPLLHLGVGGVPVGNAHVHTHWDYLESLQPMPFQDRHDFLELPHVILGEQGTGVLPDVFGRMDGFFVGGHPVEDCEDYLAESGSCVGWVDLRRTGTRDGCGNLGSRLCTKGTNSALYLNNALFSPTYTNMHT